MTAALIAVWIGQLCGCTPVSPPNVEPAVPATALEPEPTWDEQLAAVRSGQSATIELRGSVTARQWAELSEGCAGLAVLKLPQAELSDEQLALLPTLTSLRHLVLGAAVGDAGLTSIGNCLSLEIVNLPAGQFTDAGLAELQRLPLLTLLRFSSPHVTDAGMEHLAAMSNLRFVHLLEVPITDAGLEPLKRCRLLESFYLDGGKCTDEGLSCLLKAQPELHLHVNQAHIAGDATEHRH